AAHEVFVVDEERDRLTVLVLERPADKQNLLPVCKLYEPSRGRDELIDVHRADQGITTLLVYGTADANLPTVELLHGNLDGRHAVCERRLDAVFHELLEFVRCKTKHVDIAQLFGRHLTVRPDHH